MLSVTLEQFIGFVEKRRAGETNKKAEQTRKRVIRSDQALGRKRLQARRLATCPACDAVVDAEILHPRTGLCPICHEESFLR